MNTKFKLGQNVIDTYSSFEGRITGVAQYVAGEPAYQLTPRLDEDGNYREPQWFEESRLIEKPSN